MKSKGPVILRDLSEDYPEAKKFIANMFEKNSVSRWLSISHTMI